VAAAATLVFAIWKSAGGTHRPDQAALKQPTAEASRAEPPGPCPTGSPLPGGQQVIIEHIDFVRLGGVMMAAGLGGDLAVVTGNSWW
jgi:hypothetical protein